MNLYEMKYLKEAVEFIEKYEPPAIKVHGKEYVRVVRCEDCKHWRRQTTSSGAPSWFGYCDSDDMWRSLCGETCEVEHIETDDDFYCGYAERRETTTETQRLTGTTFSQMILDEAERGEKET